MLWHKVRQKRKLLLSVNEPQSDNRDSKGSSDLFLIYCWRKTPAFPSCSPLKILTFFLKVSSSSRSSRKSWYCLNTENKIRANPCGTKDENNNRSIFDIFLAHYQTIHQRAKGTVSGLLSVFTDFFKNYLYRKQAKKISHSFDIKLRIKSFAYFGALKKKL